MSEKLMDELRQAGYENLEMMVVEDGKIKKLQVIGKVISEKDICEGPDGSDQKED